MARQNAIIVGAGIAGLTCARTLSKDNWSTTLLDKGRGVGGRLATRRLGDAWADHGAPCFELQSDALKDIWKETLQRLELTAAPQLLGDRAYLVPAGINQLAKLLAQGLSVHLEQTVKTITRENQAWRVHTISGQTFESSRLLITCPLPQTRAFFAESLPELAKSLEATASEVEYMGQWTLLLKLPRNPTGWSDYQTIQDSAIGSISPEFSKARPLSQGTYVIQATSSWSIANLELTADEVCAQLTKELAMLGFPLDGAELQAHRWRYARVNKPLQQSFLNYAMYPGLFFAGDFCLGSSVEKAALSGLAVAQAWLAGE